MVNATPPISILVVDDETLVRKVLLFDLKELGCVAYEAGGVAEAMALLAFKRIDMVVTDIRMPGQTGLDLLRRIKAERNPDFPVVLMTGFEETPIWDIFDAGADALVHKPFDFGTLSELLGGLQERLAKGNRLGLSQPAGAQIIPFRQKIAAEGSAAVAFGRGGMFLPGCGATFQIGDVVSFQVEATGLGIEGDAFEGVGIVRWIRPAARAGLPAGCGIEFRDLAPASKAVVERILAESAPLAFIPKGTFRKGA